MNEKQLIQSAMYEQAYFSVISTNTTGLITSINPGVFKLLGYKDSDLVSKKNITDLIKENDINLESKILINKTGNKDLNGFEFLRTHATIDGERVLRLNWISKSGDSVPTFTVLVQLKDEDDQPAGFLAICHDITAQMNVETALEESEENYRIMTERNPVMIWKSGIDGNKVYFNRTWYDFTGINPAQIHKNSWVETVHPEDRVRYLDLYEHSIRHKKPYKAEFRMRYRDGSYRWVLASASPRYSSLGEFRGFIGSKTDIHAQKEMMKVLEQTTQTALNSEKAERKFVTNMSHEIRTPITGILGIADLMSQMNLDHESKDYLADIQISARNLLELVNNVLDFSKLQAGKMTIDFAAFDLFAKVEDVVKPFHFFADQKNIRLETKIHPDVPRYVVGASGKVGQIITNFLGNALKFTHQGSVEILIAVAQKSDKEVVLKFSVKDTGIGIPKERVNDIFKPFIQGDSSTTRKYGGTGLGLTISKEFVEAMHGQIGATSEQGKGSEFYFTVPMKVASPNDIESANQGSQAITTKVDAKVLIVEDNLINQKIALKLLESRGAITEVAHDGQEAIEKIKKGNYDLIFMDCQMPIMDGYQATKEIRDTLKLKVPVIAMTAHALKGDREKCLAAGMNDYITKPINKNQLFQMMDFWLNKTHLNEAGMREVQENDTYEARLNEIEKEHGQELLFELIDLFLQDYPPKMQLMTAACEHGDFNQVKYFVHLFRSGSANLGAQELAELCFKLEDSLTDMKPEDIERACQQIVTEYEKAAMHLSEYKKEKESTLH